jgi:type VI secretion system protein ImpL
MKRLLQVLTARWLVTLIGALALALLVWFLGPLIAVAGYRPLDSDLVRAGVMAAILVAWGLVNILGHTRAAARNEDMIEAIGGAAERTAGDGESDQLRGRLEEALRDLRRLRGADRRGRAYLYELPWYMLIGPPGSGKTTALTQSGLGFPLAERLGRGPLRGTAGTRNCDWFLTEEAVLLDTAGRYTTQDSDERADKAAWLAFLDLLKQYRPRQPINGALVAIGLSDLAVLPETERQAHARAIRTRLAELRERFGVRFPVYVLFTKADLIAGFIETFDTMSREEREQVWGMTYALETSEDDAPAVAQFDGELRGLLGRLQERAIERVQQEADLRRRGLIFGFPAQIASLANAARDLLEEVFRASRYETRPLLRGVYFTSGTQEGTPIDRLMAALVQRFGLQQSRVPAHGGGARSYFLLRLLREVIFAEASIVSANPRAERRERIVRWTAYAGCALALFAGIAAWTVSYAENRALEQRIRTAMAEVRSAAARLDAPVLADADPAVALPALDALRDLPAGYAASGKPVPTAMRFGLYQGDKLGSEEIAAYQRGLNLLLLPRLLARLQNQLQAHAEQPEYLYQALKIYLMLGGQHALDAAAIEEWMQYDWDAAYPGEARAPVREALLGHLDALLHTVMTPYRLDGRLIERAQRALQQVSLAGRAYALLKQRATAAKLAEWRISDHAGPAADRVLTRASGLLLSDGVPGLYTREGFYRFVLPGIPDVVRIVEGDSWVLGNAAEKVNTGAPALLEPDVLKLYYDDYTRVWDKLIGDVALRPFRSDAQAAEVLNLLSGPNSALRLLWRAVAEETRLDLPPPGTAQQPGAGAPQAAAAPAGGGQIRAVLAPAVGAAQPTYGAPVAERFRDFVEFAEGSGGGPPPMDQFFKDVSDLYRQLNTQPAGPGGSLAGMSQVNAAARRMSEGAAAMPPAAAGIARGLAHDVTQIGAGGTRQQIGTDWDGKVRPLCLALQGRYPLQRRSGEDAPPDDFAHLFAPNGLIDSFFNTELRPFVDTSHTPWRALATDAGGVAISPDTLYEFQLAARIRDSFFGNASTPSAQFEVTPLSIDAQAKRAVLTVDGQQIAYQGGAAQPIVVRWPGSGGVRQSVITVEGTSGEKETLERSGAWSWFRLLDAAQLVSLGAPDRWRATFSVGSHVVVYQIATGSVMNPLAVRDLARFHCPRGL